MKILKYILLVSGILFFSCGEGVVEIGPDDYEPKIVIEAFLFPGRPVSNIRIARNMPLNTQLTYDALMISDADVMITDLDDEKAYSLVFNSVHFYYELQGSTFVPKYGKSYKLDVRAQIDGKNLHASSETTVPDFGFQLIEDECTDSLTYYSEDSEGVLLKPQIVFERSDGTDFYAFSIVSVQASLDNFIYPPRNAYLPSDFDKEFLEENFTEMVYSNDELFNSPPGNDRSIVDLEWYHFMFFGFYRVTVYAGDKNFKDFYFTKNSVMEPDGNLHDPVFHIDGDGIGVFGSAIVDTKMIKILE